MSNHWHMVLSPHFDGGMSEFVGWLTLTYTQRYHAHHRTTGYGHVYQGRYKSFPVQDDTPLFFGGAGRDSVDGPEIKLAHTSKSHFSLLPNPQNFLVAEIRLRGMSISKTLTLTISPTATTSLGSLTNSFDNCDT